MADESYYTNLAEQVTIYIANLRRAETRTRNRDKHLQWTDGPNRATPKTIAQRIRDSI